MPNISSNSSSLFFSSEASKTAFSFASRALTWSLIICCRSALSFSTIFARSMIWSIISLWCFSFRRSRALRSPSAFSNASSSSAARASSRCRSSAHRLKSDPTSAAARSLSRRNVERSAAVSAVSCSRSRANSFASTSVMSRAARRRAATSM